MAYHAAVTVRASFGNQVESVVNDHSRTSPVMRKQPSARRAATHESWINRIRCCATSWNASGDVLTEREHERFIEGNLRIISRFKGALREAPATGTITGLGMEFTRGESTVGELQENKSGFLLIQRVDIEQNLARRIP